MRTKWTFLQPKRWVLLCTLMLISQLVWAAEINVVIEGIEDPAQLKNARAGLSLLKIEDLDKSPKRHIRSLYVRGEEEIKDALKPFGYYHAFVSSDYQNKDGVITVTYKVSLNLPVIVSDVHVSIAGPYADRKYFDLKEYPFPLAVGDVFNQLDYQQFKRSLLNRADRNGFFDAHFLTQTVHIDRDANKATIDLVFNPAEPYYFGPITIQQTAFKDSLIQRFITFKTGDQYSEDKVNQLQNDFGLSGLFAQSVVEADRDDVHENNEVPVNIQLIARKRFTYTAGLGYGTDTGARASVGFTWRRITRTGHSLHLDLEPAQFKQSYAIRYRIPADNPATDYYEFTAAEVDEQPQGRDLDSTTRIYGASYVRGNAMRDVQQIYSLNYQQDNFRNREENTSSELLLPRGTWEWIRAKDRFNPSRGYRARLDINGANEKMLSSTTFLQGSGLFKGIISVREGTRLIGRTELGVTSTTELTHIPPSLRFYAGGDNSVRGYAYQSLGVEQINNKGKKQIIGGSYLIVGSVEVDQAIADKMAVAVFYDTGNAMNDLNEPLKKAVGVGFRYVTPIGPLKVDFAHPIKRDSNKVRLHINIGPDL